MTAREFIAKWRQVELKERSAAQEHFIDLCRLVGHPTPAELDPSGESFCFERGVSKHGGGDGFADVWKKGFFGWEYKGKHKDLNTAYNQLLLYRDALASPPLLVLCDLDRIVIHTNFTNTVSSRHEIALEEIGEPRSLEILHAVFFAPDKLRPGQTSEAVTKLAAEKIAAIAESMRGRGLDASAVAHFLDRVVFCMFAEDIGQSPRGKWTIDFALMPLEEAAKYEKPFEYVKEHVYPVRSQNRRAAYAEKWWQYAEARPGMRKALAGLKRYIATPGVSKHRLFAWMSADVLCNQGTLVFARDDDFFFGLLHSRIHEAWSRAQGTQLREEESGCRYTPTTSFETFPLPCPTPEQSEAIAAAARELVEQRDRWLKPENATSADLKKRTLTNLYNARPTWLDLVHKKLDAAVAAAYGFPPDLPEDQILGRLLDLNHKITK